MPRFLSLHELLLGATGQVPTSSDWPTRTNEAPQRMQQQLDEARFLGFSGGGSKRDSKAVLRRKATRARLDTETGEQKRAGGWLEPQHGGLRDKMEPEVTDDVSTSPPLLREVAGGAQEEQQSGPANGDVTGVPSWSPRVRDPSPIPGAKDAGHESKPTLSGSGKKGPRTPMTGRNKKRPPKHGRRTPQRRVDYQEALQLSYSPPEGTPDREVGESGWPAGKLPITEGHVLLKLVRTFKLSRESTRSPSVDNGKSGYSPRQIDDAIKALVSIMRTLPGNTWMTRVSLKERARSKIGNTGLLNYALRVVENLEVGDGAVMRRMVHPDSHVMEYRLEKVSDQLSTASPSVAAFGAAEQARETRNVCTDATRAGEHIQEQKGGQPAAPTNMGSETPGALERKGAVLDLQEEQAAGEKREAGEEAKAGEVPRAVPFERGGSKLAQRRVDLPPIEGPTAQSGELRRERKQTRNWDGKTVAGPAKEKLARADSGWQAERPKRAAVALSPQKVPPATKGAHQRIGGAIRREEDIEEGEIRENEDRRGQSLEHEKQRRREEPGRRGLEEACERVGVEVKGEDAEAPTERNEGNGIPRADREKDGVPPRGDGGRDETCEAKNVSDCEREKRVMALEVEAAKLGLVLSNEDTEGKERKETLERVVLENSLQQLKRSLQEITSWRANAESESEKKSALEEQLKQLHVLRLKDVAAFKALKKAAEDDEREARRKLGEEIEKVEHERARACALANEAQALRSELLACRQREEAKKELEADDPPGCEICFEPWSQVTRRGALACGHDRFCTGCVADYFQTAFAQEKGGKRATYRCPLGCTLRSNKVLNLR